MIRPVFEKTFEGWRDAARPLILESVAPNEIHWDEGAPSLFDGLEKSNKLTAMASAEAGPESEPPRSIGVEAHVTVPPEFIKLAQALAYARDADRWDLLYRILYRLRFENAHLLDISVDPDILRAHLLSKSVRRDIHKMHAFVRFKRSRVEGDEYYVAWHKPEHLVVKPATPFFARRFGDRRWSIFTPEESAHWDLKELTFGPGMPQHEFNAHDVWDDVWKTYYKSIFNPARIKIKAMKLEMAPKYWSSMPETALIHDLVREAPARLQKMAKNHNEAAVVDASLPLGELRERAKSCTACPLYARATQTVFGEGSEVASIMIVGEQPGDQEDLLGRPFIGPAGEIFEQALSAASLKRTEVYTTNAVKHFKWEPHTTAAGPMRLHKKPTGAEMHACKPWLEAEIAHVKPRVIVALGVTAGTAILGRLPKIEKERGAVITPSNSGVKVIVSWHPSAILRAGDEAVARTRLEQLKIDLALAKKAATEI